MERNEALSGGQILLGLATAAVLVGLTAWLQLRPADAVMSPADRILQRVDFSGVASDNRSLTKDAIRQFVSFCGLPEHALGTIAAVHVNVTPHAEAYWRDNVGWKKYITLTYKITQNADNPAAGHTLNYYLGADSNPGVVAQKAEASAYCNPFPPTGSYNTFIAVPGLSVINGLHQ